jgi:trk system potassium uptake protein TrkH
MFIGGSPIGTAGGIKTVTMFLLIMNVRSYVMNSDSKVIFKRQVAEESMRKASAVALVEAGAILILTFILCIVNPVPLEDALFEITSACGTVGLSRGLTPSLGTLGRITVVIAMYLGRIGPISLVAFLSRSNSENDKISYARGIFYVG